MLLRYDKICPHLIIENIWGITKQSHAVKHLFLFSYQSYRVFFSTKRMCTLFKKNAILCLFLKNVSPSKSMVCFILNNLPFPMVEDYAFYALYKSRVLIIPSKANDFCLLIGLPDDI